MKITEYYRRKYFKINIDSGYGLCYNNSTFRTRGIKIMGIICLAGLGFLVSVLMSLK